MMRWAILEPLIPPEKTGGRPREVDMRQVLNGIFYVLIAGCMWRYSPGPQRPVQPTDQLLLARRQPTHRLRRDPAHWQE